MSNLSQVWPEWSVDRILGSGSFGTVYQVSKNDYVRTSAAVKVISVPKTREELDTLYSDGYGPLQSETYYRDIVDHVVREIELMLPLKGLQNIVSLEDYKVVKRTGEVGWDIYIRMELLTPLKTWLADKSMVDGSLTERDVVRLGTDLCTALEICEKHQIIHRDIKPENIFVNDNGDFKLGDFGVARRMENISQGLSVQGAWPYMAPEMAGLKNYDSRVDIYSLGLVLYQLLNRNKLPFLDPEKHLHSAAEREAALRRRLSGEQLPRPRDGSDQLVKVILKACKYDPDKRYASASEMKSALNGKHKTHKFLLPGLGLSLVAVGAILYGCLHSPPPPVPSAEPSPTPSLEVPTETVEVEVNPIDYAGELLSAAKDQIQPPEEQSFVAPYDMYTNAVKKHNIYAYPRPNSKSSTRFEIHHGTKVIVLAEQDDYDCIVYYDHKNEYHANWVLSSSLSSTFPGTEQTIGELHSVETETLGDVPVSWSREYFPGTRQKYTVLSLPVNHCVSFILEYQVIARNGANPEQIMGSRTVYVYDGTAWTSVGEFSFEQIDAYHITVNLPVPMDVQAVATVADCKKPDTFLFRQCVRDVVTESGKAEQTAP